MENAPRISVSALVMKGFKELRDDKQQHYRHILGLFAAFHVTPNLGKLYWHYNVGPQACIPPDFWAFVLSFAARFCWVFLFRESGTYLGLRRPSWTYKTAVVSTAILTTLPTWYVHIWALKEAQRIPSIVNAGLVSAIIAIVLLVPLTALLWWMTWRFSLRTDDEDANFEPTVAKNRLRGIETREGAGTSQSAPYTDEPQQSTLNEATTSGTLAKAYEEQRRLCTPIPEDQQTAGNDSSVNQAVEQIEGQEAVVMSDISANATEEPNRIEWIRCPTTARYDYMSENHSGGHSWFFQPFIPLILTVYATHREPSPTIKRILFFPLGVYLLAFYAVKHRVRVSQILSIETAFPGAWERFPSIRGFSRGYRNLETGATTLTDPRLRSFPPGAHADPSLLRRREYIKRFNASTGHCKTYWGHSGHSTNIHIRLSPVTLRLGFIALSLLLAVVGWLRTVFYDVLNPYEELLKHGKKIIPDDVVVMFKILRVWQFLIYGTFPLVVMCIVYGLLGMLVLAVLWGTTVLNWAEKRGADGQAQANQGVDKGRISL
ncbi:Nn.00g070110.m01.CDS01 [Neocucurbitaria sp. VM-36]